MQKKIPLIIEQLEALHLPIDEYVVIGSGLLSVRNIRPHNDIDLLVTEELYAQLKSKGWEEIEKSPGHVVLRKDMFEVASSIMHLDGYSSTFHHIFWTAEIVQGIPFMSFEELIKFKKVLNRPKDIEDLKLIEKFFETNPRENRQFLCMDCNKNTFDEYYVIHDEIWKKVNPKRRGMLCVECLEARLGRKLNKNNFVNNEVNTDIIKRTPILENRLAAEE